jgi:hypothetical protein
MNREDVRKLLGGYATGTLSAAERETLFAAALDDQELFDALMKEEALREVLEEPGTKAQLLAALEKPAPQPAWWSWRPLIGAVAMAGIALTAIAIWKGSRSEPAPTIVAEVAKEAPARQLPTANAPPAPPAAPPSKAPERPRPAAAPAELRARAEAKVVADERAQVKERDNAAVADKAEAQSKVEVLAAAAPVKAQQQQAGQIAPPAPLVQQQQQQALPTTQSVAVEAAPALNRAAGIAGFRDTGGADKELLGDMAVMKKGGGPLEWTILRATRELPPATVLDVGETIRLRIYAYQPGTLTLSEGDKVLASAQVERMKPFDTPAIPFTVSGMRQLRLTLATGAPRPETLVITLNYAR